MSGRDRFVNEITVTADYTVPVDMDYVYADATAGNLVITLKRTKDRLIRCHKVKKVDASANTVTVTDGTLSYLLETQNDAAIFEISGTGLFSVYGATSGSGATPGSLSLETPDGVVGGGNKVFVFTAPPVMVFYQSVLQNNSGVDYSLVGSTVTFVVAPTSGLVLGLVQS